MLLVSKLNYVRICQIENLDVVEWPVVFGVVEVVQDLVLSIRSDHDHLSLL